MRLNAFTNTPALTFGGKLALRSRQQAEQAKDEATARNQQQLEKCRPLLAKVYMEFTDAFGDKGALTGLDILEELRDLNMQAPELGMRGFFQFPNTSIILVSLDALLNRHNLVQTKKEQAALRQALSELEQAGLVQKYRGDLSSNLSEDAQNFVGVSAVGDLALMEKVQEDRERTRADSYQ